MVKQWALNWLIFWGKLSHDNRFWITGMLSVGALCELHDTLQVLLEFGGGGGHVTPDTKCGTQS